MTRKRGEDDGAQGPSNGARLDVGSDRLDDPGLPESPDTSQRRWWGESDGGGELDVGPPGVASELAEKC